MVSLPMCAQVVHLRCDAVPGRRQPGLGKGHLPVPVIPSGALPADGERLECDAGARLDGTAKCTLMGGTVLEPWSCSACVQWPR